MPGATYVKVAHPWRATIGRSTPHPSAFYAALIGQTLRFGLPASRRGGRALAVIGRRGIPENALGTAIRATGVVRATRDRDADLYLDAARAAWSDLEAHDDTLPPPRDLDVLVLRRASAITIFVFAGAPSPALVGKVPLGDPGPIQRETQALVVAASCGVAPRSFGAVEGLGDVQRGLPGRALRVEPVFASSARRLAWSAQHEALAHGLQRLASATTTPQVGSWAGDAITEASLGHPGMTDATRQAMGVAVNDLLTHPLSVLRHRDTSPQNALFVGDRFSGLVDWEEATAAGMPSGDLLNAATAVIENGIGLVRWDERALIDSFLAAWFHSPFGDRARTAAKCCATAAGLPPELFPALELVFFGRRVGYRTLLPAEHPTSDAVALAVVEAVRARQTTAP